MFTYNPTRIYYGPNLNLLFEEAAIGPRLGTRALLITNRELVRDGSVQKIREGLERAGVESILLDGAGEDSTGDIVEEARSLAARGRAGFVVGVGPPVTLDIAKTAGIDAGNGYDAAAPLKGLPLLAVPTRCWNPLLFSEIAVVRDAGRPTAKLLRTGANPDSVFFAADLLDNLTAKEVVYDLLCIFSSCIETVCCPVERIGYPFRTEAFRQAVSILRAVPTSDTPPDRESIQRAGLHAEWLNSSPGVGFVLGRSAHRQMGMSPEWVTATLIPEVTAHLVGEDPLRLEILVELMNLERTGERERDAGVLDEEVRSLIALADVPLRLRDLGVDRGSLSDIAFTAADMCSVAGDSLYGLLKAAF